MPDMVLPERLARPAPRGPLHRLRPIERAGSLSVKPAPELVRLALRGAPEALGQAFGVPLPTAPCRATVDGGRAALWLGPDEWLLLLPAGTAGDAGRQVEGGAVTEISHRQVGLVLEGKGAPAALAVGCPLDLHPTTFPVGMCTRTVFGKAEIVLWRQDAARFHLEVWRSFAPYVHGLLAAGA